MTPLAHLGGVPEALSIIVPLALVVLLLRIGARRQEARPENENDKDEPTDAGD